MDKVWIVTFDGYFNGYGSYEYLLGVYDSEGRAFSACEKIKKQYSVLGEDTERVAIHEVNINETLSIRDDKLDSWGELFTAVCLGGYAE